MPAKCRNKNQLEISTLFGAFLILSVVVFVSANRAWSLNIQTHTTTSSSYHSRVETGASELTSSRPVSLDAEYNYAHEPLVELSSDKTERKGILVNYINTLNFTGSFYVYDGGTLSANIPLHLVRLAGSDSKFSLGDFRLSLQHELLPRSSSFALSVIPEVILPTGNSDAFVSNGTIGFGGKIAASQNLGLFTLSGHIGYLSHRSSVYRNINYSDTIPYGVGAYLPVNRKFGFNGEFAGIMALPFKQDQLPSELLGGLRWKTSDATTITASAGLGAFNSAGSIQSRYVVGLQYRPEAKSKPFVSRARVRDNKIEIDGEIRFEHNSAQLTSAGKSILDDVASIIRKQRGSFRKILVEGHTNYLGSEPHNLSLSIARSKSVRSYLISHGGVSQNELAAMGYGESQPKNLPGLGRFDEARLPIDRRVEFNIIR